MFLNFHYLRAFVEVARCKSFTGAAEALHVTQPAISKAVRELESLLDIVLIERTSQQVRLTEAGDALYEHARSIFAIEQAALEDIRARVGLQRGRFAIGASTTVAAYWLPPYLTRFASDYPHMEVSLISGNTESIVNKLLDCDVDLGMVEGPVEDERINCQPWRREELVVVTAVDHPVSEKDLKKRCWIVREAGSGTGNVTKEFLSKNDITPNRQMIVGSNSAILQMVISGAGVALLPSKMVQSEIKHQRLKKVVLRNGATERDLSLVSLRSRPASLARQAFEKIIN